MSQKWKLDAQQAKQFTPTRGDALRAVPEGNQDSG